MARTKRNVTRNTFTQLIELLTSKKKTMRYRQLDDGTVYIHNNAYLLASFRYYGNSLIHNLKLNTRESIDKNFYVKIKLMDSYMSRGEELHNILKEMFPDADKCSSDYKHAYELSIVEWLLRDSRSQMEITHKTTKWFDIAIVHPDAYASCSFRYLIATNRLQNLFLRYNKRQKDTKVPFVNIPPRLKETFLELTEKELNPIV